MPAAEKMAQMKQSTHIGRSSQSTQDVGQAEGKAALQHQGQGANQSSQG